VDQLQELQREQIKTVICDPIGNRRLDKLEPGEQRAVKAAKRCIRSEYGKELLSRRGQHIERAFAHILDCGSMRRATLRGLQNLQKRFKLAAAFYNLSQLMRKLCGIGTPKQCEAMSRGAMGTFLNSLIMGFLALAAEWVEVKESDEQNHPTWLLYSLEFAA
jgi:Transposase DDE domain